MELEFKVHLVLQQVGGWMSVRGGGAVCFHNLQGFYTLGYVTCCYIQEIRVNQTAATLCTEFILTRNDATNESRGQTPLQHGFSYNGGVLFGFPNCIFIKLTQCDPAYSP